MDARNYVPALMYGANIGVSVDLTDIVDFNGNEVIEIDGTTSAVNFLRVTNSATGSAVAISAQGDDTNVGLTIDGKGSGTIVLGGTSTGAITATRAITHSSTTALVGVTTVTAAAGIVSTVANMIATFRPSGAQQAVTTSTAVNLTAYNTTIDSTSGALALTLAVSTVVGQVKRVQMIVDNGDATLTVSSLSGGTTITFADVGDVAELLWTGTAWVATALYNIADGATAPVLA